jgi:hypothetical protein
MFMGRKAGQQCFVIRKTQLTVAVGGGAGGIDEAGTLFTGKQGSLRLYSKLFLIR